MFVNEIFLSIQGESTHSGLPFVFVRLAGCNLACPWCDTKYAREEGRELLMDEVLREVKKFKCQSVEITGGEPLLQPETRILAERLLNDGYEVLIETNGSVTLYDIDERVIKIVDVKCPSSGAAGSFIMENLNYIKEDDNVKFVIADRDDYEYAKEFVEKNMEAHTENILFAPVRQRLHPNELADWILKDGIRVRLQLQIHTYIWDDTQKR